MKKNEEWKNIVNYDNYEVSNFGRIRNKNTKRILRTAVQNSGYTIVSLRRAGKTKTHAVHRLVLEAFNPISQAWTYEVNHIDWDKTNNTLENLEWVKRSENLLHGSGPTELKVLEAMLCNAIKSSLHKWYDMLLTAKCTKDAFTAEVVENAIAGATQLYNETHNG